MSDDSLPSLFEEFPPVSTEAWQETIEDDLGGRDPDSVLRWETGEGVSMPAFLRREDLTDLAHVDPDADASPLASGDADAPNGWRVRQNIAHPDPKEAHQLAQSAVERGATDLGLVAATDEDFGLDLSDSDLVATVLDDLPLDDLALHFERDAAAPVLLAATLERLPNAAPDLQGSLSYDPVAALARGRIGDAETALDQAADLASNAPEGLRTLAVDARVYHDAGATAVQELAFALGTLSETLARLIDRGHSLESLLPRLHVQVAVSTRYFVEIAKLRALRLMVPQVVDAFAVEAGASVALGPSDLFVQAEGSRRTETVFDPWTNLLRGSTEAMAAVLGGCDTLSVRPYDASIRPAENFSARIARNTGLLLDHEAHLDAVADPAAGSYYIEALTDKLASTAWTRFRELEAEGGLLAALRDGTLQAVLQEAREERVDAVEDRTEVMVGTNHYPDLDETRRDDLRPTTEPTEETDMDTRMLRTLNGIRKEIRDGRSFSALVAAVRGGFETIEPLPRIRVAEGIEKVRLRTERYAEAHDRPPVVFLAPIGPAAARSARATFALNVFGVAGFEVVENLRFDTPEDAAEAATEAGADIVVLCSSNDAYGTLTPALRTHLDAQPDPPLLVVAGNPAAFDADLPADDFVHKDRPLRDTLETMQKRLGIPVGNNT